MDKSCRTCKHLSVVGVKIPCNICFKFSMWQPKKEKPKLITYTREEVEQIITIHDDNRHNGIISDPIEDFDKLKKQKK